MSLSLQRFCKNIKLMFSTDNPYRICKTGSPCCILVSILMVLPCITFIYFVSVGLGYGMSYAFFHNTHDMLTGCYSTTYSNNTENCKSNIMCYYNSVIIIVVVIFIFFVC